ncbi:unnamed protein product [Urochloa decumbens]|uniref:Protein kinase domain-containing protein n=1 Tax=Urochloa decumbens TaxID=240449 RepID=A0ABC9FTE2_9POAL
MPPQATSTTVLIIPLILNTLSAAPPQQQTWAPMANANSPVIVHQIAHQQHHDLNTNPSAESPSWLPPMDVCSGHFGIANTTDSSVLLLLLVSLPSQQDKKPAHHRCGRNDTKVRNRTDPWTSLPLEPGIYGMPQASEKPVCSSNPFGLNISLDVGSFSLSNSSFLPMHPMIKIDDRQISDRPVGAPALFGFVLCSLDGNSSFIPSIFQDGRSYTRQAPSRYRESPSAAQPGNLLGAHGKSTIRKKHLSSAARVAFGLALLLVLCFIAGLLYWCTRVRVRMSLEDERPNRAADLFPSGPRRYSYRELAAVTSGFSDERKIGRGGFGPVYRGCLRDQGCLVAIKVLQGSSLQEQGRREFKAEVKVMTRLRHRNIVLLLGWSDGQGGLMLVYEFVPNGSLDKSLYHPQRLLSWTDRYRIALGVGSAILYLHTECEQCVLHGDIKPANILLDHSFNAKLGDFGLARLVEHDTDSYTTQVVAGTPGYMDPEFVNCQRPCAESDIFSFGVVLLEIACGRRPTTRSNGTPVLLNWVRDMYSKNSILAVADRRLDGEFDDQQMRRLLVAGLWCAHHDQSQRPSIPQAMDLLRREDAELPLLVDVVVDSQDAVRSLEEIAYGVLSAEDSAPENSSTETAYHTSTDSSSLLE